MKIVTIWLFVFYLLACGHNHQQQSMSVAVIPINVKKARVTLQVYSGRENPSWNLSERQISDLLALVGDLPKSEAFTLPDNLGYRGFQVELTENAAEKTQEIVAYKGRVFYKSAEADKYFTDQKRRLEMFLLNSAESLNEELKRFVKDEITAEQE
jgi:redox-sensitive bicupin YhaK (pirin superfamily)